MSIQLKLDTQALEALFPAGSEARVELQSAVIAEFVRKHLKVGALGDDVAKTIESARGDALNAVKRARDDIRDEVFKQAGLNAEYYASLSAESRERIRTAARNAVSAEIMSVVQTQVEAMADKLRGTITHDAQAAVNRMVDAEIREAVKTKVAAVVASLG